MKRPSDRDNIHHDKPRKNYRRPMRLIVESLEARRLLAGLNVSVLVDHDGFRSVDAADTAASQRVVFLDLNNNGQQDSEDPVAFTNDRGIASFADLASGDYAVGIAGGNSVQSQAFPIGVEELATSIGPAAKTLVAADDLSQVWAFDGDGQGQLISTTSRASKVRLGGEIVDSVNVGADAWLLVRSNGGSSATRLVQFNLRTGQQTTTEVRGLNGRTVEKFVKAGNEVVAQLSGPRGIELAKISMMGRIPTIGFSASFPNLVTVTGAANQLAIVEYQSDSASTAPTAQVQPFGKRLSVLELRGFSVQATTILPQSAQEVSVTADSRLILAAMSTGGVLVLNNDLELSPAAKLAEASSPLLTQSKDGRIVTGNSTNPLEFIVWDTRSWQPSGRTRVTTSNPTLMSAQSPLSTNVISDVVLATSGDRLIATGNIETVSSQLAKAATASVFIPEGGTATVTLGVRVARENKAPLASPVTSTFLEDYPTGGNLRLQVTDAENDLLWFNVLSLPAHGNFKVAATGEWIYYPGDNFNGTDRAIVRVFDGQTSSDIALVLNVSPVDDPPHDFRADVFTIPETMRAADAIDGVGYVSLFDVDQGSNYRFATSDQRFQIRNGRIYLSDDARFNFETESTIELEIIATEDEISGYQISTTATISIADVNEPPTAVRILNVSVPENSMGATIGQLQVEDPDQGNHLNYVLTDSRFMIEDGFLKLKPGVELDFEKAGLISMSVTVSDSSGQSITQTITVAVADQNDAPTSINVQVQSLEEATPGAVVGTVSVDDQDAQAYLYTVSDPRFEVVDGELKLKDDQSVSRTADVNLSLTVTATSLVGSDTISSTVAVPVVPKKSPFQNPADPRDVNGDGEVTPLDALLVINHINSTGVGPIPGSALRNGSGEGQIWIDVNGDGVISPIDVLIIVNTLNRQRLVQLNAVKPEGEDDQMPSPIETIGPVVIQPQTANIPAGSAPEIVTIGPGLACPAIESVTNSEIDHELESLLDQLSHERLMLLDA